MDQWADLETLVHPGEWEADQTLGWQVMGTLALALVGTKEGLVAASGVLEDTEVEMGLAVTGVKTAGQDIRIEGIESDDDCGSVCD